MNRTLFITLLTAGALAGCVSTPEPNPQIQALAERQANVASQPFAREEAQAELERAARAIDDAKNAVSQDKDEILAHELIVAEKNLDIAATRIDARRIEEEIENASGKRQALILQSRERDLALTSQAARAARAEAAATSAELEAREMELARKEAALAAKSEELASAERQAEQLAEELEELKMEINERGMVLTLSDIVFDFDSAGLRSGSERSLKKIADFLADHKERRLIIEGFTDAVGPESYNRSLAERRATTVKNTLVLSGIDPSRIETVGYGEEHPVASNDTAPGRQQNRRVEIVIGNATGEQVAPRKTS